MSELDQLDPIRKVIERHTQDVPVKVENVALELGILVRVEPMDLEIAGKIVRESRGSPSGFAIYINARDPERRRRFTLAHEIGHYVLHRDMLGDGLIDTALYRSKLSDWSERQANRFAADLLMPAALVRGLFRGGMVTFSALSEALQVSTDAVRIRLDELKLI